MEGEVLLVTGGSRGIGAAVVRRAAACGYAVAFSYIRDEASAVRLVHQIVGAGGRAVAVQGDLADPAFAQRFFDVAVERLGEPAALVNNAGVTGPLGSFSETSPEVLRRVVETNLLGTMLIAREAVRRWLAAGCPGRMVNVSSIAARTGAPGEYVHYAASKAALEALTVGLAKEVAPQGLRVNAVSPGTTDTDIHAAAGDPDRSRRILPRLPTGRVATPDEIADPILWLLSEQASYVNGAVLHVSGAA